MTFYDNLCHAISVVIRYQIFINFAPFEELSFELELAFALLNANAFTVNIMHLFSLDYCFGLLLIMPRTDLANCTPEPRHTNGSRQITNPINDIMKYSVILVPLIK